MSSGDIFDRQKASSLDGVDLSRKGSVDAPIQELIRFLNEKENFFTTSSCSGRIIVVDNERPDSIQKQGCKWILASHDKITLEDLVHKLDTGVQNAVLKFEPFVLHVQCRSIADAQQLLSCGVASGYRNSGISVGNKGKYITAIRSTHSLEVPLSSSGEVLVSSQYLDFLVNVANNKMEENFRRIKRFFDNIKEMFSTERTAKGQKQKPKSQRSSYSASSRRITDSERDKLKECNDSAILDLDGCQLFDENSVT